jgi:hypothetical protein
MNYTIVGCITNYGIDDIKPYVESIDQSGFQGKKEMLVYDVQQDVIDYLKSKGWEVNGGVLQEHIILQRFRDLYVLFQDRTNEIIIWTDVKDVIFQRNPQEWIEQILEHEDRKIFAFSECIKLKDDPWACINSGTTFPVEWQWNQENISYCAGTIVGEVEYMRDLFIEIYHWSKATDNPDQLSDQAAYNVLLRMEHFKDIVRLCDQGDGFVTQLGSVMANTNLTPYLTETQPYITPDGIVCNDKSDQAFYLVHQYDRIPELKEKIIKRYQ